MTGHARVTRIACRSASLTACRGAGEEPVGDAAATRNDQAGAPRVVRAQMLDDGDDDDGGM